MTERTELQQAIDEAVDSIGFAASAELLLNGVSLSIAGKVMELVRAAARIEINTVAIKCLDVAENAAHAAIAGMEARVKDGSA